MFSDAQTGSRDAYSIELSVITNSQLAYIFLLIKIMKSRL